MRERAQELFGAADYGAALALYRDLAAATGAGQRRGSVQDELLGASDLFYMGLCFSRLGQHDQAIEPMRQSVEIFERHWRGGNWNLIPLCSEQERFTEELDETVQLWADVLEELGRGDEAADVLERLDSHGGRRQRHLDQMWADVLHCIDRQLQHP